MTFLTNFTWRVGETLVTRIEELPPGRLTPDEYFVDFQRSVMLDNISWLVPDHYMPEQDALLSSMHSWLVRTKHHTVIVDTCTGNGKDRPSWPRLHKLSGLYLQRLAAAGISPDQVDIVICTHLHFDHIGWNTQFKDGRWVPTFPNARYIVSKGEYEHYNLLMNAEVANDPQLRVAYEDSVLPVFEAGLVDLVKGPHTIDDQLVIENAPGHTPGHILLKLLHPDGGGVFCGDVIHHPLQISEPDWVTAFCEDPEASRSTRRALLEYCCETGALLLPAHFGAPHVAAVSRAGNAFRAHWVSPNVVS